ncbi:GTP cyclohydrolase 1 [Candidatus Entotheonellaceae bacterium PAL068K]
MTCAPHTNGKTACIASIDKAMIKEGVRLILKGLGEDLNREGLIDTPDRIARMYEEIFCLIEFNNTTFGNTEQYGGIILVRDVPFYSMCEHHILPFFGTATLGYLPRQTYLGLSKLARAVEFYSHRLQVQERLTLQIANWLWEETVPSGVGIIMKARHMCIEARGIKKIGTETITTTVLGDFRDRWETRSEFFRLATGSIGV